jgi:hypothetical protein
VKLAKPDGPEAQKAPKQSGKANQRRHTMPCSSPSTQSSTSTLLWHHEDRRAPPTQPPPLHDVTPAQGIQRPTTPHLETLNSQRTAHTMRQDMHHVSNRQWQCPPHLLTDFCAFKGPILTPCQENAAQHRSWGDSNGSKRERKGKPTTAHDAMLLPQHPEQHQYPPLAP